MGMTDISESSPVPSPQFNAGVAVVSDYAGRCSPFAPARIRIWWTLNNPYASTFQARIYENGIYIATVTALEYVKIIGGQIEDGLQGSYSNWTYRVDIVRISNGAVVASQESSPWGQYYGVCSDGHLLQ